MVSAPRKTEVTPFVVRAAPLRPFTFGEYLGARLGLLPLPMFDAFHAVLLGRTLTAALELGIFEALDQSAQPAASLAATLRLPEESTRLLLGALEAAGYLHKTRGGDYGLSRTSRRWLSASSPEYLGHFLRYVGILQRKWSDLGESLRRGGPGRHYAEAFSPEEWRTYVLGMRELARLLLPSLTRRIVLPPSARSLLDVGGSHGSYTTAFCERHAELHGTIVDLPQALGVTRELLAASPAASRIELHPADITAERLPGGGYDAVFYFNMIHGFPAEVNAAIFRSLSDALATNGRLYVLDQFRDKNARGARRLLPYLVGLNLLNEAGGTSYDLGAVAQWCAASGLRIKRSVRAGLPGVTLMEAVKAGSSAG